MATYMIFIREGEIYDPEQMALYQTANRENISKFQLQPLVVYGSMEVLEGKEADGVVLLRFPDAEAARAWYYSPEYQAASEYRKRAADYRVIMVEGLEIEPESSRSTGQA